MQTLCEKKGDSSMKKKAYKEIEKRIKTFLNCTDRVIRDFRRGGLRAKLSISILEKEIPMKTLTLRELIQFAYKIESISLSEYNRLWKRVEREQEKLQECCEMLRREMM